MVRIFFMVKRVKTKTTLLLNCKGSLLSLKYCHGSEIIFFHRRHLNGRCCCYDRRSCCGCRLSLSYGCHHCSCCLSCVPNSTTSFSTESCYGCSCRSMSCFCWTTSWVCYSCRCCSGLPMTNAKRKSLADAHILNWSVKDGCCWARCSFGAGCFGCSC